MNLQIPVEKTGTRTAAAELLDGVDGGLLHPGMIGEPEIVVGSGHDQPPSIHYYLGVLRRFDLSKEEVDILDTIYFEFKNRINNATSKDEVQLIFNNTLNKLTEIGLLNGV